MLKKYSLASAGQTLFRLKTNPLVKSRCFFQQFTALADINLERLRQAGIEGIILDLDNTIISEDDRYLSPQAENWLKAAKLHGFKLFILSNGHRRQRAIAWAERLQLPLLNPARKPFPCSFYQAMKRMQLPAKQVTVIGDSLHTDVLGAWLAGCHCIQVASLPHPPRWWEKLAGRWLQIPYPADRELWTVDQ
jgi:HAD superfamily phosphatase (TIGR01668 family)